MEEKPKKQINPLLAGGILLGVLAVALLVFSIVNMLKPNRYGEETRIDNFSGSYGDMIERERELIFHQLYLAISENVRQGQEIPHSGALIRAGTAVNNYDEKTKVHWGDFIVDVASVEQSFKIQFEWANDSNNQYLGGYPVVVTCPSANLVIYEGGCVDEFSEEVSWENDYQLDYTFGATKAGEVKGMIEDFWDDGIGGGYTIIVDETSLMELRDRPEYTYQFKIRRTENSDCGGVDCSGAGEYLVIVWLENFSNEGKVTVDIVKM